MLSAGREFKPAVLQVPRKLLPHGSLCLTGRLVMSLRRRTNQILRPLPPSAFSARQIIHQLAHTGLPALMRLQSHLGRNPSEPGRSRRRVNLRDQKKQVVRARWKQSRRKEIGRRYRGQIPTLLRGRPTVHRFPPLTQWKKIYVSSQTTQMIIVPTSLGREDKWNVREASHRHHQPSMLLLPNHVGHQR